MDKQQLNKNEVNPKSNRITTAVALGVVLIALTRVLLVGSRATTAKRLTEGIDNGDVATVRAALAAGAPVTMKPGPYDSGADMTIDDPVHRAFFGVSGALGQSTVGSGKREVARLLLERAMASPQIRAANGADLLWMACTIDASDDVKLLTDAGVEPTAPSAAAAIQYGHTDMLRVLLAHGLDARATVNGMSLLELACSRSIKNGPELAALLIEKGADVDARGLGGETPLFSARIETARILIAHGAKVNAVSRIGQTPLFNAAYSGPEITAFLLAHGADSRHADRSGFTPLMSASIPAVQCLLLDHGADPNRISSGGVCAIANAATPEEFNALLAHGARANLRSADGYTPLHHAVVNNPYATKRLLEMGADPNARTRTGITPLMDACRYIQRAAGIPNFGGRALLQPATMPDPVPTAPAPPISAAKKPRAPVPVPEESTVQMLLEHGARTDIASRDGLTPLIAAILGPSGGDGFVKLLLAHHADPRRRDGAGSTPLHIAAKLGAAAVVDMLLDAGAEINARDGAGNTPLIVAGGQIVAKASVVHTLLMHHADTSIAGADGQTVLMGARLHHHAQILGILQDAGVKQ